MFGLYLSENKLQKVYKNNIGHTLYLINTTDKNVEVYQNGIRLELTQDYTKHSPHVTIINPATGLDAGDELDVVITR